MPGAKKTPTNSGKVRFDRIFERWKICRNEVFSAEHSGNHETAHYWKARLEEVDLIASGLFGNSNLYLYDRKKRSHDYWLRTVGKTTLLMGQEENESGEIPN